MPELPDLQVIGANLNKKFSNKRLINLTIHRDKKINAPIEEYKLKLENKVVNSISREGKELLLTFDNSATLSLHLMLKGQLHLLNENEDVNNGQFQMMLGDSEIKHKIIELNFEDKTGVVLADFMGQARATLNPESSNIPDALSDDFNAEYIIYMAGKEKKSNIKKFLKNQEIVRGIGNAYADEILWESRVAPQSIVPKIPHSKIELIIQKTKEVLLNAIEEIKKAKPDIISGELRHFLKIHTSKKETSPTGAKIQFIKLNSKKTYFTDEQELFE